MKTASSLWGLAAFLLCSSVPVEGTDLLHLKSHLKSPTCGSCGKETYGTTIDWTGSPSAAARRAKEEEKLVFVLHVSGHFEDAAFT